jgi:hypothetical protein
VCLAEDSDQMATEVRALAMPHLKPPRMLPLIVITDGEAHWLDGSSGEVAPANLLAMLRRVIEAGN